MQLPISRVLARPVQQLQPLAGRLPTAHARHLCNSTSAAATQAAQPAADATAAAGPISTARERREFKPKTAIKHILVSSKSKAISTAWHCGLCSKPQQCATTATANGNFSLTALKIACCLRNFDCAEDAAQQC
jgi:hypothetical protein